MQILSDVRVAAHRSEQTKTMHSISPLEEFPLFSRLLFFPSPPPYRCLPRLDTLRRCTSEDPPLEDRYVKKKVRILFPEMLLSRAFSSSLSPPLV